MFHAFSSRTTGYRRTGFALAVVLGLSANSAFAQKPVTLDRIVELLNLEVKEEKLLQMLKVQPTIFALSRNEIDKLKAAGATDRLLAAMQSKGSDVIESDTSAYVMVLDASGSMLESAGGGVTKWDIARRSAQELIRSVPEGLSFSVVVYGHDRNQGCGVAELRTLSPLTSSDRESIARSIEELQPAGKTPIMKALRVAAEQLTKTRGMAKILLITDGIETCQGDPIAEAASFAASAESGRSVDVIGFGLANRETAAVAKIAQAGKGKFYDAKTNKELAIAFDQAREEINTLKTSTGSQKLKASRDMNAPTNLAVGTYTSGRLAPKNSHYWKVDLPAGQYAIVYDVKTSDDRVAVMGTAELGEVKGGVFEPEGKAFVSENEVRSRDVFRFSVDKQVTKWIKVTNSPGMTALEDYHLGVFRESDGFQSPFLVDSPEIGALELDQVTKTPVLGTGDKFLKTREAYYKVKLPAGDFKLEVRWAGSPKLDTSVNRKIDLFNIDGVRQKLLYIGSGDSSFSGILQTADEHEFLIRIQAGAKNEQATIKVSQVDQ